MAPSPLLLLPAPSSWGPQGSNEVFLGPIGQMPWALLGGGVWGLVRVPLSLFPTSFYFSAVRMKLGTLIKHSVPKGQVVRPGLCGFGYLESVGRALGASPLRNERGSDSWGPREENWHQGTSAQHIYPPCAGA